MHIYIKQVELNQEPHWYSKNPRQSPFANAKILRTHWLSQNEQNPIRKIAINWLRSQGIDTIAEALRENGWNPQWFFAKLGKSNY